MSFHKSTIDIDTLNKMLDNAGGVFLGGVIFGNSTVAKWLLLVVIVLRLLLIIVRKTQGQDRKGVDVF